MGLAVFWSTGQVSLIGQAANVVVVIATLRRIAVSSGFICLDGLVFEARLSMKRVRLLIQSASQFRTIETQGEHNAKSIAEG
jgi:hypothetical protein